MNKGGSYVINKETGKPELVHETKDHPDGSGPRDEHGNPIVDGVAVVPSKTSKSPAGK